MRGLRRWAGYPALNRPLTILGVERRGFLLVATLGLAMWNATASLVTGGVVFAVGFGAGWSLRWSTGVRPNRSTACWAAGSGCSRGWMLTRASTSICSAGQVCPRPRTTRAPAS